LTAGLTGYGSGTTPSTGLGDSFAGYDDTPYASGALGAPTASATGGADTPAAGSGMPMMPMGMGGAPGAGGGQSGNGDRVRNVLTEPGGGPLDGRARRTGKGRKGAAAEDEAEDATTGRSRVSTSSSASPFAPQASEARRGGRVTESGGEERASWLADEEDEDVWGAEEGGAPSVIGR